MANNYCVCCGDEIPEGRQVCSICEVEKLRSGGDLNAVSEPGTYTANDEPKLIGKVECGVEIKKCAECEYKLRCDECVYKLDNISLKKAIKVIKGVCEENCCAECPLDSVCSRYFGTISPDSWDENEVIE